MNILMLSWRGPGHPHFGGAEINTMENAVAWTKAGHQVVWFTSEFPGGKENETVNGVEVIRKGSQNLGVHLTAFKWYLFEKHIKFDVVVDQFHGIPFFTPLYVRVPKLGFIHEVAHDVWWLNPWPWPFNLIAGFVGSRLEPMVFMIYRWTHFMTVSNSTKEDLMNLGIPGKNIHVFLSGVNLKIPRRLPKKSSVPVIMFLGALSKDKGIEDAISAFSAISTKRPTWRMWVVGKGDSDYQRRLLSLCKDLKIDKKIKFWGFVSASEKYELLAKSHVLVNPSVREGWGLVNIEANAMRTPVVGYDVPGTRDSVCHGVTGILVPLHHTELLAENIIRLLENKKLYKQYVANGLRWSKQFSWTKFTRQSLALIERLVANNTN